MRKAWTHTQEFRDALRARVTKHGHAKASGWSAEYNIWKRMRSRCGNPNDLNFRNYGARGIFVCEEWREDFSAFLRDVGPRPDPAYQLDRIDNGRWYEPGNVRWATRAQNMRNTRNNLYIEINGETKCATDWNSQAGFARGTIARRYNAGWRDTDLLLKTLPPRKGRVQSTSERAKRSESMKRRWLQEPDRLADALRKGVIARDLRKREAFARLYGWELEPKAKRRGAG